MLAGRVQEQKRPIGIALLQIDICSFLLVRKLKFVELAI